LGTGADTDSLAHGKIGAVTLDLWVPQIELIQAQGIRVHVDNLQAGISLVNGIMGRACLKKVNCLLVNTWKTNTIIRKLHTSTYNLPADIDSGAFPWLGRPSSWAG